MAPTNALRDHLVASAQQTARPVIDAAARDDWEDSWMILVQAGMAAELLLRAIVADLSPGLLFATGGRHSEVVAALRAKEVPPATLNVQTITAKSVRDIVVAAHPSLESVRKEMATVASLRDSVVHMFAFAPSDRHRAIDGLVSIVAAGSPCIDLTAEDFWGEGRSDLATALQERHEERMRSDLAKKIRLAKVKLDGLQRNMTTKQYGELLAARRTQLPLTRPSDVIDRAECPACKAPVLIIRRVADADPGSVEGVELVDWGPFGPQTALIPQVIVHQEMTCTTCGLHLTADELAWAGFSTDNPWDVEPRRAPIDEYEALQADIEPPF